MVKDEESGGAALTKPVNTGCAMVTLIVIALGCLLLGLRMLRPFLSYQETTCVIVNKRLESHLSRSKSSSSNRTVTTRMYRPELTFTYAVGDRKYKATGYSGIDVSSGSREAEQEVLDSFQLGSSYPCWYDPERPSEAVLVRGTLGSLAFTAFPMVIGLFCAAGAVVFHRFGTKRRPPRHQELPVRAVHGGAVELRGRFRSGRELVFLAAFALVWNGMMSIFLTLMITRPPKDAPWIVYGILGLFTLIGAGLLISVVTQALRLIGVKRPILALESVPLRAGGRLQGKLGLRGPLAVAGLQVSLLAEETVTTTKRTRKGRTTTVSTEKRHEQSVLELADERVPAGGTEHRSFEATLPPALATNPDWNWSLRVSWKSQQRAEIAYEFPIDSFIAH